MEKITKVQLNKLPKWAVNYINYLQSEVNRLNDIVDIKTESHEEETNTHIIRLMERIPLPNNSISIHTDSSMLNKMAISPIASNTFDIVFHNHKQFDKNVSDE